MTHVDHDMFLNKDGLLNGGVEVEVSNPTETQSVQVKGQRRMLAEKKSKAEKRREKKRREEKRREEKKSEQTKIQRTNEQRFNEQTNGE